MSALFQDVKSTLNTPKQQEPHKGLKLAEVLYAHDTLLFGTRTHSINNLFHAIQRESKYYNMQFNRDKCIYLTLYQKQSSIRYVDGTPPRKQEATYLGTMLSDAVDNHREINSRIGSCH